MLGYSIDGSLHKVCVSPVVSICSVITVLAIYAITTFALQFRKMSLTYTVQEGIGKHAPDFNLPDAVEVRNVSLADVRGEKGTVVMFICNHCPFVIHVREELVRVANEYAEKGFGFVAISSNNVETHPGDSPEKMKLLAKEAGFTFPYLFDEDQSVAKAYEAACTPDIMVYDGNDACVYRGRLDGSTPGNTEPNDGADLRAALNGLLNDEAPLEKQLPSMGCNIKWKAGNEPHYFALA